MEGCWLYKCFKKITRYWVSRRWIASYSKSQQLFICLTIETEENNKLASPVYEGSVWQLTNTQRTCSATLNEFIREINFFSSLILLSHSSRSECRVQIITTGLMLTSTHPTQVTVACYCWGWLPFYWKTWAVGCMVSSKIEEPYFTTCLTVQN